MVFHLRDGLFFDREKSGVVAIYKKNTGGGFDVAERILPNEWASVVAAMGDPDVATPRQQLLTLRAAAQNFISLFVWEPHEETGEMVPHLDRQFPDFSEAVTKLRDAIPNVA